jgi:hypothetical protein
MIIKNTKMIKTSLLVVSVGYFLNLYLEEKVIIQSIIILVTALLLIFYKEIKKKILLLLLINDINNYISLLNNYSSFEELFKKTFYFIEGITKNKDNKEFIIKQLNNIILELVPVEFNSSIIFKQLIEELLTIISSAELSNEPKFRKDYLLNCKYKDLTIIINILVDYITKQLYYNLYNYNENNLINLNKFNAMLEELEKKEYKETFEKTVFLDKKKEMEEIITQMHENNPNLNKNEEETINNLRKLFVNPENYMGNLNLKSTLLMRPNIIKEFKILDKNNFNDNKINILDLVIYINKRFYFGKNLFNFQVFQKNQKKDKLSLKFYNRILMKKFYVSFIKSTQIYIYKISKSNSATIMDDILFKYYGKKSDDLVLMIDDIINKNKKKDITLDDYIIHQNNFDVGDGNSFLFVGEIGSLVFLKDILSNCENEYKKFLKQKKNKNIRKGKLIEYSNYLDECDELILKGIQNINNFSINYKNMKYIKKIKYYFLNLLLTRMINNKFFEEIKLLIIKSKKLFTKNIDKIIFDYNIIKLIMIKYDLPEVLESIIISYLPLE